MKEKRKEGNWNEREEERVESEWKIRRKSGIGIKEKKKEGNLNEREVERGELKWKRRRRRVELE